MCLVSIAWQVHPDYPLVFVGNRDEYHARPAAPADWWEDESGVLGGRDLEAGGSWLAINRAGHFAVVTNRPDLPAPETGSRSRGELVTAWVAPPADEPSAIDLLEVNNACYGGFSLLLTNSTRLLRLSGGYGTDLVREELPPGIYGLSNTAVDDPWPKLTWLNERLGELLASGKTDHAALLKLLLHEAPVAPDTQPAVAGIPFIRGDIFGTRCATVVTVDRQGECRFTERSFGPGGAPLGAAVHSFTAGPG